MTAQPKPLRVDLRPETIVKIGQALGIAKGVIIAAGHSDKVNPIDDAFYAFVADIGGSVGRAALAEMEKDG
tara:strand:+ start:1177 stop:1389 length:213 start_codon:yes stop_codon:yes gene_type:complete